MAVGDAYRFTVEGRYDFQKIVNVLYYQILTEATPVFTPQTIVDAWEDDVRMPWLACASSSYTIEQYTLTQLAPTLGPPVSVVPAVLSQGTLAGDGLPGTVAAVFSKRTGFPGPSGRGRMYFAGVAESDTTLGRLSATANTRYLALANALRADIQDTGSAGVLAAVLFHAAAPGSPPTTFSQLTAVLTRQVLGNQRRRRIDVGV